MRNLMWVFVILVIVSICIANEYEKKSAIQAMDTEIAGLHEQINLLESQNENLDKKYCELQGRYAEAAKDFEHISTGVGVWTGLFVQWGQEEVAKEKRRLMDK